jgi:hypothetical protein
MGCWASRFALRARVGLSAPSRAAASRRHVVPLLSLSLAHQRCASRLRRGYRRALRASRIKYAGIKYLILATRAAKRRYLLPERAKPAIPEPRSGDTCYQSRRRRRLPATTSNLAKHDKLSHWRCARSKFWQKRVRQSRRGERKKTYIRAAHNSRRHLSS